jgi:hypothetical protein
MNIRSLMVGNIVTVVWSDSETKKVMVTEIYKDKVKVMDVDSKEKTEIVVEPNKIYEISITSDLLENVLNFSHNEIKTTKNAIESSMTKEWLKVIENPDDPDNFYFLILPDDGNVTKSWGLWEFEIYSENRNLIARVSCRTLHDLQNQVMFNTGLVLC